MKYIKKLLCLLLALAMVLCAGCSNSNGESSGASSSSEAGDPAPAEPTPNADVPVEETGYEMGDKMPDFTVTTFDGKTVTLSEVLKEKDMVLINIWATWCGPCASEFPFMEEAYEQYQDKVEIIALSCEPTDTDDVLADYVAEMGMTFPVAQDTPDLATAFEVNAIPTSIIVDRFGTICFIEAGSQSDVNVFTCLFDLFIADDYTESVMQYGVPSMKPNVVPSSEADLAAALNGEGGSLAFTNGEDSYSWPMLVGEQDGRSVVVSSNSSISHSEAVVNTTVNAKAGDAVVVTFKLSSEAAYDLMHLRIDGETVKSFGGEHDWMSYAYRFDADGEYAVSVAYSKDQYSDGGEDTLWVDSIELLSGDAADAAVSANPVYVYGDATVLTVTNPDAREIVFDDPDMVSEDTIFYIVPGDTANFLLTLAPDLDPETLSSYCNYDGSELPVLDSMTDDGYVLIGGVDSIETTGYSYTDMSVYCNLDGGFSVAHIMYFASEENVNDLIASYLTDDDGVPLVSWTYADGTPPSTTALPGESADAAGLASYIVRYVDQNGQPVAGVSCQICDDSTCVVYVSDENGVCEFILPPYPYEIHTLKVPEGYEGDTTTVTIAPAEGGELTFTLQKQ